MNWRWGWGQEEDQRDQELGEVDQTGPQHKENIQRAESATILG